MMEKILKYRNFCKENKNIPVFLTDWWLDAVCGKDNWDVATVIKDGKITAFLPFWVKRHLLLFNICVLPRLTQFLGPWIDYPSDLKESNRTDFEKKIMTELISQIPKTDYFEQNFHFSVTNWLPFYWKNFRQTTRYTYIIEDLSYPERIYEKFHSEKRYKIKKASERLTVKFDLGYKEFYDHHKKSLSKRGAKILYSEELFERIYRSAYENKAGRTAYAVDEKGNIHSAIFVIWSKYSAYYLINSIDEEFKSSDSVSLLTWEMIKFLSGKTYRFDFEGSMIEQVERSFRQYGTVQRSYFNISRTDSALFGIFKLIRDKTRRI